MMIQKGLEHTYKGLKFDPSLSFEADDIACLEHTYKGLKYRMDTRTNRCKLSLEHTYKGLKFL